MVLLYFFRVFERQMGTERYAVCVVDNVTRFTQCACQTMLLINSGMSILLQLLLLVLFGMMFSNFRLVSGP